MFKKQAKFKAQAIVEGSIAFLLMFLIFIFITEFALYFQNIHANQAFADDVSANIASYTDNNAGENFCSTPGADTINTINDGAKKYLDKNIELQINRQNPGILVLKTSDDDTLTVNIICSNTDDYIVRSEYIFRGFFLFRLGHIISSISSVQTPEF